MPLTAAAPRSAQEPVQTVFPYADRDAAADAFARILPVCCAYYRAEDAELLLTPEEEADLNQLRTSLRIIMGSLAQLVAALHPPGKYSASYPGYIEYDFAGVPIFVPWNILDDLPSTEIVRELCQIAQRIKSAEDTPICISGSVLYFGSFRSLSDLDFCEYHNSLPKNPATTVDRDPLIPFCTKKGYFQYLVKTQFAGTVEATNKMILLDPRLAGYRAAPNSHPLQEAPLGYPPRNLTDPISLGAYVSFLAKLILDMYPSDGIKAAKRALPFARLVFRPALVAEIQTVFGETETVTAIAVKQKLDLMSKILKMAAHLSSAFNPILRREIQEVSGQSRSTDELTRQEMDLIEAAKSVLADSFVSCEGLFRSYHAPN
jgi:hypothetical protein